MNNERTANVLPTAASVSHIAWSAVFAGVVMALVLMLMLMMLGISIGLASINPATEDNPFGGLAIGSAIWWVISGIISLFFGGWVAARMAGLQRKFDGALHGLVTWALCTLLMIYLVTSAVGAIVSGTFKVVGNVFQATGQAAGQTAKEAVQSFGGGSGELLQQVKEILPDLSEQEKQQVQDIGKKLVKGESMTAADRQTLTGLLAKAGDMTQPEADQKVREWEQKAQEAKAQITEKIPQVKEKAEDAAGAMAKAAFWSFVMLLLCAIAGAAGGAAGRVAGAVEV